jgi:hypothetical protein
MHRIAVIAVVEPAAIQAQLAVSQIAKIGNAQRIAIETKVKLISRGLRAQQTGGQQRKDESHAGTLNNNNPAIIPAINEIT